MSIYRTSERFLAAEIDGDDSAWLRGQLPPGAQLHERIEVDFFGRTFVEQPSGILIPDAADPVDRFVEAKLEEAESALPRPVGIDLFCGAGGFTLGLHEAGFDVLAALEWDASAATTYLHNLGSPECRVHMVDDRAAERWECEQKRREHEDGWIGSGYLRTRGETQRGCREFFFGDAAKLSGETILDALGVDDVAVVFGGPPCQGLSRANPRACIEDPRNALLWEFMRLVEEIGPRAFIIENVPQLLTVAKGALFEALCRKANEAGYNVVAQKCDASWYGVPQYRRRALVVGTMEGSPGYRFPMPTHWALGRRVDGRRWAIGEEAESMAAEFDPESGTWSAPGEEIPVEAQEELAL